MFAKSVSCYKALSFIYDEQVFGKERDITPSAGMRRNLLLECDSEVVAGVQETYLNTFLKFFAHK